MSLTKCSHYEYVYVGNVSRNIEDLPPSFKFRGSAPVLMRCSSVQILQLGLLWRGAWHQSAFSRSHGVQVRGEDC